MTTQSDLVAAVAELVSVTNVKLATLQGKVDEAAALRQAVEEALEESPSAAALQVNLQGPTGAARIGHEGVDVAELLRRLFPVPDSVSAEAYAGTADRLVISDLRLGGVYPYNPAAPNVNVRGRYVKHPSGVGAYERDIGSDPINVQWLGVKGDGTNEKTLIDAAKVWALEANRPLWFPTTAKGYYAGPAGHDFNDDGLTVLCDNAKPDYTADFSRLQWGVGTLFFGAVDMTSSNSSLVGACGVDSGEWVRANIAGGAYMEGLLNASSGDPNDLTTYKRNWRVGEVRVLCPTALQDNAATWTHCFLAQRVIGVEIGFVEVHGGFHGFVLKCLKAYAKTVTCHGQVGTTYIFKSDSASSAAGDIEVGVLCIGHPLYTAWTGGTGRFEALGLQLRNIRIGQLLSSNCDSPVTKSGDELVLNVSIGHFDYSGGNDYVIPFKADATCRSWRVGTHQVRDVLSGFDTTGGVDINIGSGSVTNAFADGYKLKGDVSHGNLRAENCGGYAVKNEGCENLDPSRIKAVNCALGSVSSLDSWVGQVTLASPWQPFDDYGVQIIGSRMRAFGLIKPVGGGPTTELVLTVAAARKPKRIVRGTLSALDANTGQWGSYAYALYPDSGSLLVFGANTLGATGIIALDGLEWYVGLTA